jgi:ribosomal protein S27AE
VSEVTWLAPERCPDCGASLVLADDGTGPVRADCGSCGYADTWTVTCPAGRNR